MNLKSYLRRLLRPQNQRAAPGRVWIDIDNGTALRQQLNGLPSETSIDERMFLYLFGRETAAKGNILELGPFLGGTTRALARGAEDASGHGLIVTVDQFESYHDVATFRQLDVEIPAGYAPDERIKFRGLFEHLHRNESYYSRIRTISAQVPDEPGQSLDYSFLKPYAPFAGVFIDGCKSWYSVKHFLANVLPYSTPGASFIFQDYGRYTCFWIPVFVELFADYFRALGSVDSSRILRLEAPLTPAIIEQRYPDDPCATDPEVIGALFERIFERERNLGRVGGMVTARIQAAGYQAYIGNHAFAKRLLLELRRQSYVVGNLSRRVDEALISPTYTPGGPVLLA